ncbi:MAG TPA: NUDIX hydrolase [Anaerolineae bacterium]|nr:NUDIX hydrolase [Anaerolineae bacterium]
MPAETVDSSEYKYRGHIINLRIDQIHTASGYHGIREIVEHPGAVAIVPIDENEQVILVQQYRHAVGKITIEIPAGTLSPGEDPLVCVRRELKEETGYQAAQIDRIGGVFTAPGISSEFIHLYLATGLTAGESATEEDEAIDLLRVSLSQAIEMIHAGSINDAKSVSALLLVKEIILPQG